MNGDGVPDLVVTDYNDDNAAPGGGRVRIFSGSNGATIRTMTGAQFDALGYSAANAGDIDLDGVPDLLVGAPQFFEFPTNPEIGYAKIFSGRAAPRCSHFSAAALPSMCTSGSR